MKVQGGNEEEWVAALFCEFEKARFSTAMLYATLW